MPWEGIFDATVPGPTAPQPASEPVPGLDISPFVGAGWRKGDNFLNLNIWAPHGAATGLTAMVFVHGGSFTAGSNADSVLDGSAFARSGVVLVSVNYRLGVEGFLALRGAPTNLGLRDQIAALRWVRDNIASFGGDPENVTLFGESAGAIPVAYLVTSPQLRAIQLGVPLARVEILDDKQMMAVNRRSRLDYAEVTTLFFEFHGSERHVAEQVETMRELAAANGGGEFLWSNLPEERSKLWKARH